ncbi:MAG: hypothetical protein AAGC63_04980 [Propionicimonas sp.]|nr:hypothetical protein [Propionicimonas sp.]
MTPMIRRRTAALAAGAVLLIGGVAAGCSALGDSQDGPRAGAPADGQRGMDTTALVTALADGLGIDEATVKTAVDKAMSESMGGRGDRTEDGTPSSPPTTSPTAQPDDSGRGGSGMASRLAAAIAAELDADEATVLQIVSDNLPGGRPGGGDAPSPEPTTTS